MNLLEKVKNLPSKPGVYLMKDSLGSTIYVGKSKNLSNRVPSYFRNSKDHSPKIKRLVKHLKDFEIMTTDTEFEALLLECQLIKEIQPMYNRMMKNPQAFIYVVIEWKNGFRSLKITNNPSENDRNISFGPFTSRPTVEKALLALKESFKINCSNSSKNGTPCLNYSIGLCNGVCLGGHALEQYNSIFDNIISLFQGNNRYIIEEISQMMDTAAENFDFEAAARYRDYLDAINSLLKKEKVIEFTEESHNIAVIEKLNEQTFKLFLIKRTRVLFSEKFHFGSNDLKNVIQNKILSCFNLDEVPTTKEVCKQELDEAQIIYSYINGKGCSYMIIPENWLKPRNKEKVNNTLNQFLHMTIGC